jgi:hypothetical protein
MSIVCHGTRIVAGNPGNSRPLRSSWTISGAKVQQKNDISKFLRLEIEEKCKKGENDYRKPVSHSDSVYTLRSNSPHAQRILPYPYDKIRLREGIYYIPNGRLSIIMGKKGTGFQKRSRLLPA